MERDLKDTKLILSFRTERNSFSDGPALRNIVTGVTASDTVNAKKNNELGLQVDKNLVEHSLKK